MYQLIVVNFTRVISYRRLIENPLIVNIPNTHTREQQTMQQLRGLSPIRLFFCLFCYLCLSLLAFGQLGGPGVRAREVR